tara:strand:- start:826 stop:1437 length:612 start_codon:yes stop_codon:yes gene_type:complete
MKYKTDQEDFWAGQFGIDYIDRNKSESLLNSNIAMWDKMLRSADDINSVRELGCNIGLNLLAINQLKPNVELSGYEINEDAINQARELGIKNITKGSILEKIDEKKVDLTFTKTVLIHINPDYLKNVYENLVNGSNRYVLVAEYYNPVPVQIEYRGHDDRLYKRDFAGDLIENYGLNLVDYGFVYKRDKQAPQDDISWFLLQK